MAHIDPIAALFDRAKENQIPMVAICRKAGVAPTTPSRWKRGKNSANLDSLSKMNEALDEILSSSTRPEREAVR